MWRGWWPALALVSCARPPTCGENTTEVQGVCMGNVPQEYVEPEDPSFTQALADLSPCDRLRNTEGLDLYTRCAGPVCVGQQVGSLIDEAGPGECSPVGTRLQCAWDGVDVPVEDRDGDGQPDRDDIIGVFYLNSVRYGSVEGLGVGAGMSCFVDTLGAPQIVGLVDTDEGLRIGELYWSRPQVRVGSNALYTVVLEDPVLAATRVNVGGEL